MGDRPGLGASERRGVRPVGIQASFSCLSGCRHRPPACRAAGTVPLPVGLQASFSCLSGCRHRPPACRDAGTVPLPVGMQASFPCLSGCRHRPPACRAAGIFLLGHASASLAFLPFPARTACVAHRFRLHREEGGFWLRAPLPSLLSPSSLGPSLCKSSSQRSRH